MKDKLKNFPKLLTVPAPTGDLDDSGSTDFMRQFLHSLDSKDCPTCGYTYNPDCSHNAKDKQ